MEWQQIIGFYNLVRHESFTRAAGATFRTQSALSQQIKKLENELQCQLINRFSRRQFSLTPAGERLFEYASNVMEGHQRLLDDLSEIKGLPRGQLKIASPFTTLYHLFLGQFKAFIDKYPYVELTIFDRPQSKVLGLLKRGEIDIGVALASQVPKEFKAMRWKEVQTVLIVPSKHPLTKLKRLRLSDIAGYPLILPPRSIESRGRATIEEKLKRDNIGYRIIMESSNVELSSRYVEQGLGIAFGTVVKGLDLLKGRKIKFMPLNHIIKPDNLSLAIRRNREIPHYMEAFIKQVLKS